MRHAVQKRRAWYELPLLPGLLAAGVALGLFYAQTAPQATPEGVSPQVRPVNTVTTGDAECTWGTNPDYPAAGTYSGTFTVTATGSPTVTDWTATFTLPAPITSFQPGTVTDAASHSIAGIGGPTVYT